MLFVELNGNELFSERGGDEVDHRPAEADEKAKAAGEVRDRQVCLRGILPRFPRDHRFDSEFGKRLEPGQDGQGQALGDEKLRGFCAPGDHERRKEDARKRPDRGQ